VLILYASRTKQKGVSYIAFFNLAFDTGRPDFVRPDQSIEQAVVTLCKGSWREALYTPFVFDSNVDVFKILRRGQVARFGR
jgi:hypothetical protein